MIPYQKEKIENAICFFSREYRKKTNRNIYSTSLYKYIAWLDFTSIEETGEPALGLTYRAMVKGPVPLEIYDKRDNYETDCFKFKKGKKENTYYIYANGTPDLGYFCEYEIDLMKNIIDQYANKYRYTEDDSEDSHDIQAWKKTWNEKGHNLIIDYVDQFPERSTPAEEHFLIYQKLHA